MKIDTKFYNQIEVNEEEFINFPTGIPGFEEQKRFIYLKSEDSIFGCLQSVDKRELGFVVVSPFTVCPDYHFDLNDQEAKELRISKLEEILILSIVSIPEGQPRNATINLQAPIVINTVNRLGVQVILTDLGYPLRCRIWADEGGSEAAAAKE